MRNTVLLIPPVYPVPKIFFRTKQVKGYVRISYLLLPIFFSFFSLICVAQQQSGDNPRTNYVLKKFMPDADVPLNWQTVYTNPWPHFRLAEIFLNYAESKFGLGDEAACRQYLSLNLLPIETSEIRRNSELAQTPGW
jgi:hypothetical protein